MTEIHSQLIMWKEFLLADKQFFSWEPSDSSWRITYINIVLIPENFSKSLYSKRSPLSANKHQRDEIFQIYHLKRS